jgi:hypothetical protein
VAGQPWIGRRDGLNGAGDPGQCFVRRPRGREPTRTPTVACPGTLDGQSPARSTPMFTLHARSSCAKGPSSAAAISDSSAWSRSTSRSATCTGLTARCADSAWAGSPGTVTSTQNQRRAVPADQGADHRVPAQVGTLRQAGRRVLPDVLGDSQGLGLEAEAGQFLPHDELCRSLLAHRAGRADEPLKERERVLREVLDRLVDLPQRGRVKRTPHGPLHMSKGRGIRPFSRVPVKTGDEATRTHRPVSLLR